MTPTLARQHRRGIPCSLGTCQRVPQILWRQGPLQALGSPTRRKISGLPSRDGRPPWTLQWKRRIYLSCPSHLSHGIDDLCRPSILHFHSHWEMMSYTFPHLPLKSWGSRQTQTKGSYPATGNPRVWQLASLHLKWHASVCRAERGPSIFSPWAHPLPSARAPCSWARRYAVW